MWTTAWDGMLAFVPGLVGGMVMMIDVMNRCMDDGACCCAAALRGSITKKSSRNAYMFGFRILSRTKVVVELEWIICASPLLRVRVWVRNGVRDDVSKTRLSSSPAMSRNIGKSCHHHSPISLP
jgi:hypothetical protein